MSNHKSWWKPISHFAGPTFVGTTIFLIIGSVAVGLSLLIQYLESIRIPSFMILVLSILEHLILIVDAVLYLVYPGVNAWGAVKEMIE